MKNMSSLISSDLRKLMKSSNKHKKILVTCLNYTVKTHLTEPFPLFSSNHLPLFICHQSNGEQATVNQVNFSNFPFINNLIAPCVNDFCKTLMKVFIIQFLLVSFIFRRNNLQDHKANENHDFAVRDDFQVLQKTLQGNEPTKFVNRNCKELLQQLYQRNYRRKWHSLLQKDLKAQLCLGYFFQYRSWS